jgi:hypothetical protein
MAVKEVFSRKRIEKCVDSFKKIYLCGPRKLKIFVDEDIENKSLKDLTLMYFDIQTTKELISLPFIDMLVVFDLIHELQSHRHDIDDDIDIDVDVKTCFEDEHAEALMATIKQMIQINVREKQAS